MLYICTAVEKRRDGRVVECGGLENHCTAMYRGFESLSLRKATESPTERLGFFSLITLLVF